MTPWKRANGYGSFFPSLRAAWCWGDRWQRAHSMDAEVTLVASHLHSITTWPRDGGELRTLLVLYLCNERNHSAKSY